MWLANSLSDRALAPAFLGRASHLVEVVSRLRREERVGHLQALQRQVRFDAVELLAELSEHLGKAPGRDDERRFAVWPLGLDAPNGAVDRIGGAEDHARSDAVLGAPPDGSLRNRELRGRKLRRLPCKGL